MSITLTSFSAAQLRNRGRGLTLRYGQALTPAGTLWVAATTDGICRAVFSDEADVARHALQARWPEAVWQADERVAATLVQAFLNPDPALALTLQVEGSAFQLQVWQALLQIPPGATCSYLDLALQLGRPQSARAVGNAVGANPVACLIPCHRVLPRSGGVGGYRWGAARKQQLLALEQAR